MPRLPAPPILPSRTDGDVLRVALCGDLSGHLPPLLGALADLGVAFDGDRVLQAARSGSAAALELDWPDDLHVDLLGDVVHRGPDSDVLVAWLARLMDALPGRVSWRVGNHEAHYLPGAPRFWREPVGPAAQDTLKELWSDGRMSAAGAWRDRRIGDVLVSHAGVGFEFARRNDLAGLDAAGVAAKLNSWVRGEPRRVFQPGSMLGDPRWAGPVWAETFGEVVAGWLLAAPHLGVAVPFSQVHGHAHAVRFDRGRAVAWMPPEIVGRVRRGGRGQHIWVEVAEGRWVVGIDPQFGRPEPSRPLVPLVFEVER